MQKYQTTQALDYKYVRQQTRSLLVQIINCQAFGAKPSPERMLNYGQLNVHTNLCKFLIKLQTSQLNATEKVVCKMLVISFQPQYVNNSPSYFFKLECIKDQIKFTITSMARINFLFGKLIRSYRELSI